MLLGLVVTTVVLSVTSGVKARGLGGVQVEAKMQELKAKQQSPFTIDKAWLAQQRPALLLTQDACRACDVDSDLVVQVCCLPLALQSTLGMPWCTILSLLLVTLPFSSVGGC